MKKSDFKKRLAEEVHAGWRGFANYILGKAIPMPDGSMKIPKDMVMRWRRMVDSTHYKLQSHEKAWANALVDRILVAMKNMKQTMVAQKSDPRVAEIKAKFVEYCKNLKGFAPEIDHGKDGAMIKKRLENNTPEEILDCFDWFLTNSDFSDFSPSISTALSTSIFNKFLSKR